MPRLETNFDGDYPVTQPLRPGQWGSRFSVHTLHSRVGGEKSCGDSCQSCMARVPYATLIATIMCCLGVGVFCTTMYRGATLSILMLDSVFHLKFIWIETVQMVFVVGGACMGALGLMLLCLGCLATGATRHKVYRVWRARVGGRISCAIFMSITYVFSMLWLVLLCFLVLVTFIFTMFWQLCSTRQAQEGIDFKQFGFVFPSNTPPDHMEVKDERFKSFCKDCVEKAEVMFILATVACLLVILSLIHYLMCLSANYAHIRDHEKFQELQEMQYLDGLDRDVHASKERF